MTNYHQELAEHMRKIEDTIARQAKELKNHQDDDKASFGNIEKTLLSAHEILKAHDSLFINMKNTLDKLATDSEPVNQWFKNITFSKSAFMWIIGIVGSIIGIIIGFKKIFLE